MNIENKDFTHIDKEGNINMVDISNKDISKRVAIASGKIKLQRDTIKKILSNEIAKGNVLATAKIASIMAAKNTQNVIPLCHQINLTKIDVDFNVLDDYIEVVTTVCCIDKTGAEMEALHCATIGLLTIYDMCKAIDKNMVIEEVKLCSKSKEFV